MLFLAIAVLLVLVLPRWINSASSNFRLEYLSGYHGVTNAELEGYNFLKNDTHLNSTLLLVDEPSYVHYASLANVLTQRNLFFSGTGVSQIITPEYLRREKDVNFIKSSKDDKKVDAVLKKDKINYVILYNNTFMGTSSALLDNKYLKEVFSNSATKIFKVN